MIENFFGDCGSEKKQVSLSGLSYLPSRLRKHESLILEENKMEEESEGTENRDGYFVFLRARSWEMGKAKRG